MLTNILIASPEEATAIAESRSQATTWPCLELNGLDNAKLAALLAALGSPIEAKALEGEHYLAFPATKGGPWIFLLPHALRDALASLQPAGISDIAERWVSHEELAYDGWSASDVEPLIQALRQLAADAAATQKALLLWMSL